MEEILDGVHHWTAVHPNIGMEVNSYYVAPARTVIDPIVPDEALEWFREREESRTGSCSPTATTCAIPSACATSSAAGSSVTAPACTSSATAPRSRGSPSATSWRRRSRRSRSARSARRRPRCTSTAAPARSPFADGLINYGGIRFVPDNLIGDNPEPVKEGLRRSYARLLDRRFDALLFAHGEPITEGGMDALKEFLDQ